jgi:hypothetical protein
MDFPHIWIKIIVTKVEKELLYASLYNLSSNTHQNGCHFVLEPREGAKL